MYFIRKLQHVTLKEKHMGKKWYTNGRIVTLSDLHNIIESIQFYGNLEWVREWI